MAAEEAGDVIGSNDFLDVLGIAWIGIRIVMSRLVWFLLVTHDMDHIVPHTGGKELPKVVVAVSRKEPFEYLQETDVTTIILKGCQLFIRNLDSKLFFSVYSAGEWYRFDDTYIVIVNDTMPIICIS